MDWCLTVCLRVVEVSPVPHFFQELGIAVTHSNVEVVCGSDVIFVAVKPHLVPPVLNEVSQHITNRHIIVSVAAGVTIATLEEVNAVATMWPYAARGHFSDDLVYPLSPEFKAPSREFSCYQADAKPAMFGPGGGSTVCHGVTRKTGGWSSAPLLVASLWTGGGGARGLDRHPHGPEWQRSGLCECLPAF